MLNLTALIEDIERADRAPRLEVEKLPGGWVAIYVRVEGGRYLLSELSHRAFEKDAGDA